jgi:hypothetical protein
MKKRTLHTTKILAVVLTSLTGCAERPAARATAEPEAAEAPSAAVGAAAAPRPTPVTAAPPERPMSNDPGLLALAAELHGHRHADALADLPRYRPLCDVDGYPLVGNLVQGKGDTGAQPSDVCAVTRQKKATP